MRARLVVIAAVLATMGLGPAVFDCLATHRVFSHASAVAAPPPSPLADAPWGSNVKVNDDPATAYQYDPSIAVDSTGNAFAVWGDRRGGTDIYFSYRPAGGAWGPNVKANDGPPGTAIQFGSSIAVNPSGNAYALWVDERNGNPDIYSSYRPAGGAWGPSVRVDDDVGGAFQWSPTSIAVDSSGNAYAVWEDKRNGNWDIYFSYHPVGGSWGANVKVNDDPGTAHQSEPSIAVDSTGNAYAVWEDRRNGYYDDIYFSYRAVGGSWGTNVKVNDDSGSEVQYSPSIAVDPSGNAYAMWQDSRNANWDIYFSYRPAGGAWGPNAKANDDPGTASQFDPSIAVDSGGNACAVWQDERNGSGDIYSSCRPVGGSWGINVRVSDDAGTAYQFNPSIAADPSGNAYAVWDDRRNEGPDIWNPDIYFSFRPADVLGRQISGVVSDGHAHALPGVFVGLLVDGSGSYAMTGYTESDGTYAFSSVSIADTYVITVILRDASSKEQILYGEYGLLVSAETAPFSFGEGETSLTKDIDFADPALISDPIPVDRLDDLAAMFYHTRQTLDFVTGELCLTDYEPVTSVWGFAPNTGSGAYYSPAERSITIEEDISEWAAVLNGYTRPTNREWHESFHHLMNMTIGMPPFAGGTYNHEGYDNPSTDDSWAEGWAEFWPCVLWGALGYPNPHLYHWPAVPISFEENWLVWDYQGPRSREEFAVASLLWDLYDPKSVNDSDPVDLSLDSLWDTIGATTTENDLTDMRDVYNALWQADLYNEDGSPVNLSQIDQVFIAHGFYADGNGNDEWDPGEEVGWGGQPGRRNAPDVPNAVIRVHVVDPHGRPLAGSALTVDIKFEDSYYDYSYQLDLAEPTGDVPVEPPPPREPVTIEVSAQYSVGTSDAYSIDNAAYWDDVAASTSGYAEEITLVVNVYATYLPVLMRN